MDAKSQESDGFGFGENGIRYSSCRWGASSALCWGRTSRDRPRTTGSDCYVTTGRDRMSLDLAGTWHRTKWSVKQLSLGGIVHLVGHVVGSPPSGIQPRQGRLPQASSKACVLQQRGREEGGRDEGGGREGGGWRIFTFLTLLTHFDQVNFVCLKTQNGMLWGQIPRNIPGRHHSHGGGDCKKRWQLHAPSSPRTRRSREDAGICCIRCVYVGSTPRRWIQQGCSSARLLPQNTPPVFVPFWPHAGAVPSWSFHPLP